MLLALPALTAVVVIVCAVVSAIRPAARPLLWAGLALALINLGLTPFTSGEWSYQRAEMPAYQEALVSGDFSSLDELTTDHDRFRLHKMIAVAAGLLGAMVVLAAAALRAGRGAGTARTSVTVTVAVAVALVGLVSLIALSVLGLGK